MIEELARRYREGATLEDLSADFDVPYATLRAWFVKAGIPRRKCGKPHPVPEFKLRLAVEAYRSGDLTVVEIGKEFGISIRSIQRAARRAGLPPRSAPASRPTPGHKEIHHAQEGEVLSEMPHQRRVASEG